MSSPLGNELFNRLSLNPLGRKTKELGDAGVRISYGAVAIDDDDPVSGAPSMMSAKLGSDSVIVVNRKVALLLIIPIANQAYRIGIGPLRSSTLE